MKRVKYQHQMNSRHFSDEMGTGNGEERPVRTR